jgi:hypothetical protein
MSARSQLDVIFFGQPHVLAGGHLLKFAKHQVSLSLLAYLIVHRGETVSRPFLAFTLFPDDPEETALAELRRYLSLANKTLPNRSDGGLWITSDADSVAWNAAPDCYIDVAEFERLAAEPGSLSQAVDIYRGDFLEDTYDDWIVTKRERLRSTYIAALGQLIRQHRSRREFPAAIGYAQRMAPPMQQEHSQSTTDLPSGCALRCAPSRCLKPWRCAMPSFATRRFPASWMRRRRPIRIIGPPSEVYLSSAAGANSTICG